MTLKNAIIARRAVRTYTTEPVRDAEIEALKAFLGTLKPLHPEIRVGVSIISREDFKRSFRTLSLTDAQHYVVLRSARKEGYLQNIGFIGEQIALWLTQQGIGTCWIGSARAKKSAEAGKLPYVAAISFGRADNAPPRFSAEEANRKLIDDIVMGKISHPSLLPLLEAGRLAPSSMNRQPVRYITESTNLFIYRKRPFLAFRSIEDKNLIDVGTALANIYIMSDCTRVFIREKNYPTPIGNCVYEYTAIDRETLKLEDEKVQEEPEQKPAQTAAPEPETAPAPKRPAIETVEDNDGIENIEAVENETAAENVVTAENTVADENIEAAENTDEEDTAQ